MKKVMKNQTSLRKRVLELVKDESGQTTTEYVLLLVFVIIAVRSVGGGLKGKLDSLIGSAFKKAEDEVNNM